MNNQHFTNRDYDMWCEDYKNGLSTQKIADKYAPNGPSKSLIRKIIEKRGITRTHSEAQEGRIPWNKGKTGGVAWNSGMASTGNYPYASPFKGKTSPFKGIPRSKEDRAKISHSIRLQNREHWGFYPQYIDQPDSLYLIQITSEKEPRVQYKVGRTFNSLGKRFNWQMKDKLTIKTWSSNHLNIFELEDLVLHAFKDYHPPGPENFPGATEFFSEELPLDEFILYVDETLKALEETTH